jgi:hypothetical protein
MSKIKNISAFLFSKHFVKHFGLVLLFYVVVILSLFFYLNYSTNHGEKIFLPNFIGTNSEDAKNKIKNLGLEYQILDSVYDITKPPGTIIDQNPMGTATSNIYVKTGRVVSFRVTKSTKRVDMPSLVDKQIQFAETVLAARGLKYIIKYKIISERSGAVIEQLYLGRQIKPGEQIQIGSQITLIVGQKDEEKSMLIPDLVGLDMDSCLVIFDSLKCPYLMRFDNCLTLEDSLAARVLMQSPEFIPGTKTFRSNTIVIRLGAFIKEEGLEQPNDIEKEE